MAQLPLGRCQDVCGRARPVEVSGVDEQRPCLRRTNAASGQPEPQCKPVEASIGPWLDDHGVALVRERQGYVRGLGIRPERDVEGVGACGVIEVPGPLVERLRHHGPDRLRAGQSRVGRVCKLDVERCGHDAPLSLYCFNVSIDEGGGEIRSVAAGSCRCGGLPGSFDTGSGPHFCRERRCVTLLPWITTTPHCALSQQVGLRPWTRAMASSQPGRPCRLSRFWLGYGQASNAWNCAKPGRIPKPITKGDPA